MFKSPAGLLFPDSEKMALRQQQEPAGMEHQSGACGGSSIGGAGGADSRGLEVQALEHE